jgi:hypothetical protein
MNYAARRQLKEKCFRTVIHSVTSTRLLFKHGGDGSQVAAQMTSLIKRGFEVPHCLLRAGETIQVSGFLQMLFSVWFARGLETNWFIIRCSMS